jgi:VWFA-related protein
VYPETSAVNVLLLDGLNTPQTDQMNVRRQMIESLGKIKPGTSLAIFTLSSRLQLVKGFTTDVAQLRDALQSVKAGSQSSVVLNAEGGSSMATAAVRLANSANGDPVTLAAAASMAETASKTHVYVTDERVHMTLDAMQQLARYLSGVPGRKNLIWFSGSFPIALGPDNMQHNYAEDVRKTSRLLLAARVAVYPVDARGLREMPSADASYVASANMTKSDASSFVNQTTVEQNSMTQIAEQTGGQAYVNTNGLKESVERIVENGSSYYTLAYVPSNKKADGKFRTVRLRLDHADYKLSYRPGYYADTPDSSAAHSAGGSSGIMAATLLGAPAATQILFQARVLAATDPMLQGVKLEDGAAGEMTAALKGPVRRYIVDLMVDPRSLLFEEMPDGARRTDIEFAVVAYDAESRRVNYLDRGSRVSLNAEQYSRMMAAGVPVRLALDVPVGQIALRVVVYDPATRRAGSLEVPVIVAAK